MNAKSGAYVVPADMPWPMGCEAVEAVFVYGSMRCMKRATGVVPCTDCYDREPGHVHPICPEHGGPADEDATVASAPSVASS